MQYKKRNKIVRRIDILGIVMFFCIIVVPQSIFYNNFKNLCKKNIAIYYLWLWLIAISLVFVCIGAMYRSKIPKSSKSMLDTLVVSIDGFVLIGGMLLIYLMLVGLQAM